MHTSTLLLYLIAVSAVMITPGPSMLLALNNGACYGMRVALWGMAGAVLSDLLLIAAVGCGLGDSNQIPRVYNPPELVLVDVNWY